jgi:catechol 2,3-dioxygenase-like lactoylglutathione lyase family enzyme
MSDHTLITSLDHVQLAMPRGGEEEGRDFYVQVLGFREVPKPASLAARGGLWFEAGTARVHLGVEDDFRPARKAHPAFMVTGLSALGARCEAAGHAITRDNQLPGADRFYARDPFGNRLEFLEPVGSP